MKVKSLINAIKKTGLPMTQSGNAVYVHGQKHYGKFNIQGESAICVSYCRNGDESDSHIDYFPQSYVYTIKGFIQGVTQ